MPKNKIFKNFQFLFIGRLLFDKGIREYIEAANILKKENLNIDFNILGPFAFNNSSSITEKELDSWIISKTVNYLGNTDDVKKFLVNADCVVLPSYREGMSKALIEASLTGLPIVTSDVPGCRDVIENNVTGFTCKARNSKDLADKMKQIFLLDKNELIQMKQEARNRGVRLFDDKLVIKEYKKVVDNIFH